MDVKMKDLGWDVIVDGRNKKYIKGSKNVLIKLKFV